MSGKAQRLPRRAAVVCTYHIVPLTQQKFKSGEVAAAILRWRLEYRLQKLGANA